jgi:hypothetical protein
MYRLFNFQTARTHKKKGANDLPGGKQKDTRLVDVVPMNNNNDFWENRRASLVRSLSQDSFSTITTAAETPDSCFEISMSGIIEWEDGKLPAEIFIGQHARKFWTSRARVFPKPPCLDDDEADNEEEEEYQKTFLPERLLPRQQNFRIHPSKSTFYDEDLEATAARH